MREYRLEDLKPGMVIVEDGMFIGGLSVYVIDDVSVSSGEIKLQYRRTIDLKSGAIQDKPPHWEMGVYFSSYLPPDEVFSYEAREATEQEMIEWGIRMPKALPRLIWRTFGRNSCLVEIPGDEPLGVGDLPYGGRS
jgi:hypothetical protein